MSTVWRRAAPFVGVAVLAAAIWALREQFRGLTLAEFSASLRSLPATAILLALLLTIVNYAVLTGYDLLAFVYLGRKLPTWQICMASYVGYAVSNNVGFAVVSGASARYRFYSRWGLTAQEISRIVLFYSGTFWLGLLLLGGLSLLIHPPQGVTPTERALALPLGVVVLALCAAYAGAALFRRRPIRVFGMEVAFPRPALVAAQFALSTLDWALADAVFWSLLPRPRPPFFETVGSFVAAQVLGLVTQVPGAIGIFEATMTRFLHGVVAEAPLASALVVFRVVYYIIPLTIALTVVFIDGWYQRRHVVKRWGTAVGSLTIAVAPRVLAIFTFIAGAVLLFSGATPAVTARLNELRTILPEPIVELSHFLGSLIGLLLLLVSQALARRVDAAWTVTVGALVAGMAASLLKGFDYEEATLLALLLVLLVAARGQFDRRSTVFQYPFQAKWFIAVILVVLASVVLGDFAFRQVRYSEELWWRFAFRADASRFLRSTVGVSIVLLAVGLRQLLRPAVPVLPVPTDRDLDPLAQVIASQRTASAYLVYLRDKGVLWNADRTGFLMYGVQGRTWVALHDPVGPPSVVPGLIRQFLELVDDSDGVPVFYEVRKDYLHRYADFGLAFAKAGEEALVPLAAFSLDGGGRKKMRLIVHRLEKEGASFRIVPHADVPAILPQLREVSDEWLAARASSEKGFSLGFFNEDYVARFPAIVLEVNGRVEAFANIWPGPRNVELSVDLMRFRPGAPKSSMEGLLIHLMLWGKAEGYQWFNLGMAPLSGLEATTLAPLWVKIATYLYRYGDVFYNFQGLRAYKDKFDPVWDPIYLAYPGGLSLPRVLTDVSALIAGGYHGFLIKRNR